MEYHRITRINEQLNDRYVAENAHKDVATYPKLITITTTYRCNYRCWMCYQKRFSGELNWAVVKRLQPVLPFVRTLQFFGGEPFLYERIKDLYTLAAENGCETEIITNGSLLDHRRRSMLLDHGATLVKISLEAATQATYSAIRGGQLDSILNNINSLAEEKVKRGLNRPMLQINFVAMRRNIKELSFLVRRAAEVGVDKVLVLYLNAQDREELAVESLFFYQKESDSQMAKAIETGRNVGVEVDIPGFFDPSMEEEMDVHIDRTCHSPWKNCIVEMDGTMQFCCGGAGNIGNLVENTFDELWYSEKIRRFRKVVNTGAQPTCCRTCRVKARNFRDVSFHIRNKGLAHRLMEKNKQMVSCHTCS